MLPSIFDALYIYVCVCVCCRHEVTRHLFYLQLRRDVLEERCGTTEEQGLRLAGLALQAEYEDWVDKARHTPPEHYLAPSVLRKVGLQGAADKLPQRHRQHGGMADTQAELLYIKVRHAPGGVYAPYNPSGALGQ